MKHKIQGIKDKIKALDWVLTGTILKSYKQCGRVNCRCAKSKRYRHGPYYIWTRKEKGKTITKTLTAKQARACRGAFLNTGKLHRHIEAWRNLSRKYIDEIA